MARSLNRVQIIGNLGADPELRSTTSGARVASLSVATSRRWTNRQGEQQEKTEWHRVVAWDRLAEICERYLKKGDRVCSLPVILHQGGIAAALDGDLEPARLAVKGPLSQLAAVVEQDGQVTVFHHLKEHVECFRVCLFDLIKQQDDMRIL